jgi:hypothetical protein
MYHYGSDSDQLLKMAQKFLRLEVSVGCYDGGELVVLLQLNEANRRG